MNRRTTGRARRLRSRLPVVGVVLACVVAVVFAVSGAATSVPGLQFLPPGHWVFNAALSSVFHVDGATASVDARAEVPGAAGSLVVQGESSGYVVGDSRITEFGKSSLEVEDSFEAPSDEQPVGIEVAGGPYLVYPTAGKVVRLGEQARTMAVGGPVGAPVSTKDGTVWLPRVNAGLLCRVAPGEDAVSCPVALEKGHTGAMTVIGDRPVFLDSTSDAMHFVHGDELGDGRPLGVDVSNEVRLASTGVGSRVVILDKTTMHFVEAEQDAPAEEPVTVALPEGGEFDGPVSTGSVVAIVDRTSGTLLTYDAEGKQQAKTPIPKESGDPRLTRGEDDRIYVDGAEGEHVLVVDRDGSVAEVPVREEDTPKSTEEDEDRRDDKQADTPADQQPPQDAQPPQTPQPPVNPASDQEPEAPQVPASPPGAPAGVQASAGAASATVTWGAAPDNRAAVTGYTISWPGGSTTAAGGARSSSVGGLANGTSYVFTVTATNSAGTGPGASSNAIIPAVPMRAASAPLNVAVSYDPTSRDADLSWAAPADLGGGRFTHYLVNVTGSTDQVATGTTHHFDSIQTSGLLTFTVRTVTQGQDGQQLVGEAGTATAQGSPPAGDPVLTLARGEDSESEACVAPNCSWLNVTLSGFEPNTTYTIDAEASEWGDFSEPCVTTTDASGAGTCNDTRFDGAGQEVWVFTDAPTGQIQSARLYWEPR